jgi:hypothetical protein
VNADGSPTEGGSGNGAPARANTVDRSYELWKDCRAEVEGNHPELVGLLNRIEALMMVLDVEEDARFLSGETWLITTPEDHPPVLSVYFTYRDGLITLRAVWADD